MGKSSAADPLQIPLTLAYSAGILCFHMLFNWLGRCRRPALWRCDCNSFMANFFRFLIQPHVARVSNMNDTTTQIINSKEIEKQLQEAPVLLEEEEERLSREEVEMVMGSLGIVCGSDSNDRLMKGEFLGPSELSALFEELEPSLDELKEAFGVFDANRDGFIDAEELHGILCKLAPREGYSVSACGRMIRAVSKNGYERIDLKEFVSIMENSLCRN